MLSQIESWYYSIWGEDKNKHKTADNHKRQRGDESITYCQDIPLLCNNAGHRRKPFFNYANQKL
jgi:hypothetical protein